MVLNQTTPYSFGRSAPLCAKMVALFFLLLLQSCFLSTSSQQVLCVVHQDGVSTVTKLHYNCSLFANNLSSALLNVTDDTTLVLFNDEEVIESIIEFADISDLTLIGVNGTNIVCSQEIVQYGLKFINVTNIHISGMTIINCGALYHYGSNVTHQGVFSYHSSSAVYFENCTNIRISSINVSNSHGTGLTLYDSNDNVSITHSTFINNTVSRVDQELSTGRLLGGGGIYYELSMCSPSWDVCDPSTNLYNSHATLHVHNCTFYNNSVTTGSNNVEFSKYIGGGLMVWLSGLAHNNSIFISSSYFSGNSGLYGGGLFVLCKDQSSNNSIVISNSILVQNEAILGGGGLDLGFYFTSIYNRFNSIIVRSCTIVDNKAYFGGGVVFFVTSASRVDPNNRIEFYDTVWNYNKATYGSAIYLEPLFNNVPANTIFPIPHFANCSFINNSIIFNVTGDSSSGAGISAIGAGTMNSKAISFTFSDAVTFSGNNGTALYLIDGNAIVLEDTLVNFSNNTGTYGGAVSINGFASIYTSANTSFTFLHNVASVKGGAIFFHSTDIQSSLLIGSLCFVERIRTLDTFETNFYFENNTDSFGKTMYISSLLPCNKLCQGTQVYLTYIPPETLLSECIGKFTFADHKGIVRDNVATETSEFHHYAAESEKDIVPGKDFLIPFVTRDELGHESMEPLFGILRTENNALHLDNIFTANNKFQLKGQPNDTGHLEIGTLYYRNLTIGIDVTLSACPPGFINYNNTCVCSADYDSNHYYGIVRCDNKEFVASLSSGFWIGYVGIESEDNLYTGLCPQGYCNSSQILDIRLPSVPSSSEIDSLICGANNRTGVLCGDCIENNSVYYNSPGYKCGNNELCSYGPLFYLLSNIIPLTLMFTIIIMLGVNFSSGRWNGFVFFAQIVGYFTTTNGVLYASKSEKVLHIISDLFYQPFSLRFFNDDSLSFCLFKNGNFFAIMGMEILSLFFAFLLVVTLVFVMKSTYFYRMQSACCKRPFFKPTSLTKALATFLILCYSQTTQICFKILQIGFLRSKGDSIASPLRVQRMGSQVYFTGFHIPLAIAAVLGILTIVTITPLCLMAYPVFYKLLPQKVQEKKLVAAITMKVEKLKPIFDVFQGCFDDKYRFFAGLYFLYRVIFVSLFSLINLPLASLSIAQIIVMIMLAVHLKFQPYQKKLHNNIDGCLLLLLGMINTLTLTRYFESISQSQRSVMILTGYIQITLVYLPIFIVLLLIISLAIKKYRSKKKFSITNLRKASMSSSKSDESLTLETESPHSPFVAATTYLDMDIIKNANNDEDDGVVSFREELQVLEF